MEDLGELLSLVYKEKDPEKREKVESKLTAYGATPSNFIPKLLELFTSLPQHLSRDECLMSAAIHLRQYLKRLMDNKQLNAEDIIFLSTQILKTCTLPNIRVNIVENLSHSLAALFTHNYAEPTLDNLVILEKIIPIFKEALSSSDNTILRGVIMCLGNVLFVIFDERAIQMYTTDLQGQLFALAKNNIQTLKESMALIQPKPAPEVLLQIQSKCEEASEILDKWVKMYEVLLDRFRVKDYSNYDQFAFSPDMAAIIQDIIMLTSEVPAPGQQAPATTSIIWHTGFAKLDEVINKIKIKAMAIMNMIVDYLAVSNLPIPMNQSPFFILANIIAPYFILSLFRICGHPREKLEEILEDKTQEELVVEMLKLLSTVSDLSQFYSIFAQNKQKIIVDIILVLLCSSSDEKEKMVSDPHNFVTMAIDTCENQESELPKTEASKLLENICDHIDGSLTFLVVFCCETMAYQISGKDPAVLANCVSLKDFEASVFMNTCPELVIDSALMALTDVSYLTPKREDIFRHLESAYKALFDQHNFDNFSTLVKSRIALSLAYYLDNVFLIDTMMFCHCIQFLVKSLFCEGEAKALAYQASDALKNLISDPDLVHRIEPFINELFTEFCEITENIKELPMFFSIMLAVVNCYSDNIDKRIIELVNSLVKRVQSEMQGINTLNGGPKTNQTIQQCWNVIRAVTEQETFIPLYQQEIEEALKPLLLYMGNPLQIDFDEDIIQIIATMIRKTKSVTAIQMDLFTILNKYYDKAEGVFGALLPCLNMYILHAETIIKSNPDYLKMIIKMGIDTMFITKREQTINNSEGAILLQIILQSYGGGVLNEYIPQILASTVKRIQEAPQIDYLTRELMGVIYTCIMNNPLLSIELLQKENILNELIQKTIQTSLTYKHSYDRKVVIIGLSTIISQHECPEVVKANIKNIMELLISILVKQTKDEVLKAQKHDKRVISLDPESSSEEEEDLNEEGGQIVLEGEAGKEEKKLESKIQKQIFDDLKDDIGMTLDQISCRIKRIDEFHFFGQIIRKLNSTNPQSMSELINMLEKVSQTSLKDILRSKRVVVQAQGVSKNVIRKMVKAHRPTRGRGNQMGKPIQGVEGHGMNS